MELQINKSDVKPIDIQVEVCHTPDIIMGQTN
jgi:hypothetical protein